jgi:hypothetical protein
MGPVPAPDLEQLSDEELAASICTWAGRLAAGEARLLVLIAEYDARGAWSGPGMLSCAHWLSWRLGMGLVAARERVRVGRLLRELPVTAAAFAEGRLSWTQVRALTRCATAESEARLVDVARHCTGAQLEKLARGLNRVASLQQDAVDPFAAEQRMRSRTRYDEDGTLVLTLRVPAAHAPAVLAGLERIAAEVQSERDAVRGRITADLEDASAEAPEPVVGASAEAREAVVGASAEAREAMVGASAEAREAVVGASAEASPARGAWADEDWNARLALDAAVLAQARYEQVEVRPATLGDALVRMAARALDAPSSVPVPKDRLVLQVDPLSGSARAVDGELLPPGLLPLPLSGQRGAPPTVRPLTTGDLTAHDLGRTSRVVSGPLRRLLGVVDGERCRFPGCSRVRKLHAHHVVYWSDGGPTDLANLVLLCSRHHTVVHAQGFQLTLSTTAATSAAGTVPVRTLAVRTAEGIAVPHLQAPAWEAAAYRDSTGLDPYQRIDPETLPPQWHGEPMDLSYVTSVLLQHAA